MKHIKTFESINESVFESIQNILNEGSMSDIHILAQEAKDEKSFIAAFFKEHGNKIKKNAESIDWLKDIYVDAAEYNS